LKEARSNFIFPTFLLKTPLVHIVILGGLLGLILLVVFGRPSALDDTTRVVVSAGEVAQLRANWMRTWQREPSDAELRGLIERYVRDEVLYREAVRLGYDKDDQVIRQTLKRKMEFLGEAQAQQTEPSLKEIQAYLAMRKDRYRIPPTVSFTHIFFSVDRRGASTETDALLTLETIQTENLDPEIVANLGDRFMLKDRFDEQDKRQIGSAFGDSFAEAVVSLEPGIWHGPIESAYGLHLVKVSDRKEGYLPELEIIKEKILSDMDYENRQAARDLFYTEILRNYQIEYEDSVERLLDPGGPS
jgi:parvulin-like peptidyl-prolyl isomerase